MITDKSLELFKKAVAEVPAYKAFLKSRGFKASEVKEISDFANVPLTSKKTYLQNYDRRELMWPESVQAPTWYCSTSGSTGEPYYFPRDDNLAWQASQIAEEFLINSSHGQSRTLLLIGFGMGVWIGGTFSIRQFEIAAERMKAPLSILPVGYNKPEMFKALKKLAPEYEQTIICGYPPFIKELVDEADHEGVDLKKLNIRVLFAAEAFTETFRNYISERAGIENPLLDTLNIYGTADNGAMAHETPLSILVRRLAVEDPLLYQDMFKQIEKTPTLAQYNPEFIEFEEIDGEIVLTSDAALPLIRYAVGDHGGVLTYQQVEKLLAKYDIILEKEIKKSGIKHTVKKQPFVYVYERTDLSTTLHGLIIYPEFVKEGLLKKSLIEYCTERFTMSTKHDIHHDQFLQINVELQPDVKPDDKLQRMALKAILSSLIEKSSEFAEVSRSRNSANLVRVVLWPNNHPRYFAAGVKQKWVEKT